MFNKDFSVSVKTQLIHAFASLYFKLKFFWHVETIFLSGNKSGVLQNPKIYSDSLSLKNNNSHKTALALEVIKNWANNMLIL